jgi:hypothetical protein
MCHHISTGLYYISLALWITVTNSCHRERLGGEGGREGGGERATLHILIFLVGMSCNLVHKYQHCLNRSGEDGANRFFEMLVSSPTDTLSPKP